MLRSRGQSSMGKPNKTGDCEGVLQSLNIPDFFKTTIGSMAPEKKAELVTACNSLDKSELNKIIEKVGSILVPRLREWKEARCNIETSIESVENGLALKFVEEFMSGSQMIGTSSTASFTSSRLMKMKTWIFEGCISLFTKSEVYNLSILGWSKV